MGSDNSDPQPWARIEGSVAMEYLQVDGVISRGRKWMGVSGLSHANRKHAEV